MVAVSSATGCWGALEGKPGPSEHEVLPPLPPAPPEPPEPPVETVPPLPPAPPPEPPPLSPELQPQIPTLEKSKNAEASRRDEVMITLMRPPAEPCARGGLYLYQLGRRWPGPLGRGRRFSRRNPHRKRPPQAATGGRWGFLLRGASLARGSGAGDGHLRDAEGGCGGARLEVEVVADHVDVLEHGVQVR